MAVQVANDPVRLVRIRQWCRNGTARSIRTSAGLSLADIAQAVGEPRNAIYRWESGANVPRSDAALRYFEVLEALVLALAEQASVLRVGASN